MLYRIAIIENVHHKWVVYKIRYQRLKDRMTLEHFVGDMLGYPHNTLAQAAIFTSKVHELLERIQSHQTIIDDKLENDHIRLQSRAVMTTLLRELSELTSVKHP